LASLTTAPAARFGNSEQTGGIKKGTNADLVLLAGDPANDSNAFSQVVMTLRNGQIIFQK
jgi:imidazolonepropionase-like amidohydrolase